MQAAPLQVSVPEAGRLRAYLQTITRDEHGYYYACAENWALLLLFYEPHFVPGSRTVQQIVARTPHGNQVLFRF